MSLCIWIELHELLGILRRQIEQGACRVRSRRTTILEGPSYRGTEKAQHTPTSQELITAITTQRIRLHLDESLEDIGAVRSGKVIRVHPRLINVQTSLGVLVHEGRHALDIQEGIVPAPRRANPRQRLLAEGRAWVSEVEFLRRNSFSESVRWKFVERHPRELLMDLEAAYDIQGITTAEMEAILQDLMASFSS